jgi:hypothetical protein
MRRKDMKTEAAVLASQTRLMLSQAENLTAGQGQDRLGNFLNKHGLKPVVQDWLNDAGLRMVEYSMLMNFGKALRTLGRWILRPLSSSLTQHRAFLHSAQGESP